MGFSMIVIVMGVAGSGKTTVGKLMAGKLGLPFFDADDFHPVSNVVKLGSGVPLSDEDRAPWLSILAARLDEAERGGGAVLACSALKEKYRVVLRGTRGPQTYFVYLKGEYHTILERMKSRTGHYMPTALLLSQFEALEEPADAVTMSVESDPGDIAETACEAILEKNRAV
jgi:carbohydrate kinase (thermoresistant glucokinase family)